MEPSGGHDHEQAHDGCGECGCCGPARGADVSRRDFLKATGIALGAVAASGLAWPALAAAADEADPTAPPRQKLTVKPILTYDTPRRRPTTSWRNWGGIHTQEDADKELKRIDEELAKLAASCDFPIQVLPASPVRGAGDLDKLADLAAADTILIYAAGGSSGIFDAAAKTGKHVLFFLRHRSGPVSLWYEIISPRYLRRHGDALAVKGIDYDDVVVDSAEELGWRLRALCGLKNALGTRIVAIGGASGWGPQGGGAPDLSRAKWKLDIQDVPYKELAPLIQAAMADEAAVQAAKRRAEEYLKDPAVKLETQREFVDNAFLLERVFRALMAKANARAITVNACMGTIMPMSKTTACLTLSLLNDAGYLAFCESDFVVIPAGIALSCITGRPNFLNDPTYPHAGQITLAHCTAPRRMDGRNLEAARILTHFESDYGAAPKVEMKKGQPVTMVIPDFAQARYVGLAGEITDAPFLDICRSQVDVAYKVPDALVAENMPGFHWEMVYGDCLREMGYCLKKIPIAWEFLG